MGQQTQVFPDGKLGLGVGEKTTSGLQEDRKKRKGETYKMGKGESLERKSSLWF